MMMKTMRFPAAALLVLSVGACSDTGPTGATEDARTEVRVAGDAPEGGNASRSESPSATSGEVEGSVQVAAHVYLQNESGTWVKLTGDGAAEQTVDASGEDGFRLLASSKVDATTYQRVRVEFEDVQAEVDGALALQLGSAFVSVDLGSSGSVVVEREIEHRAEAGSVSRIDIDLNAQQWMDTATDGGVVARSTFESAVSVTAR